MKRRHRREIPERIQPPGETVQPLDEDAVLDATADLVADGVESIAVCYLHSYLDPTHEQRTGELIEAEFLELSVSTPRYVSPTAAR